MARRPIQLVTRADDAGSSRSANRAIAEAVQAGFVRNVSVMATGRAVADAARALAGSDACVGLHVTLNSEWDAVRWGPVARPEIVPSLVRPDGTFFHTPQELLNGCVDLDEVVLEVRAQLSSLRRHGFDVKYVDEHMGVGWLPGLRERLFALAAEEDLIYGEGLAELPRTSGVGGTHDPVLDLTARLSMAAPGTYVLVTHPAFGDAETKAIETGRHQGKGIASERDKERRVLCDPRVLDACRASGVEPCRYTDVRHPATFKPQVHLSEGVTSVAANHRTVVELT